MSSILIMWYDERDNRLTQTTVDVKSSGNIEIPVEAAYAKVYPVEET